MSCAATPSLQGVPVSADRLGGRFAHGCRSLRALRLGSPHLGLTRAIEDALLLDLEANYSNATYNSELYNFPSFKREVPQLLEANGWLDHEPFGPVPANKLNVLRGAEKWTAWLGYPGYANPAVSEVYHEHLLSTMMANAASGKQTPKEAVETTTKEVKQVFAKWRAKGYLAK